MAVDEDHASIDILIINPIIGNSVANRIRPKSEAAFDDSIFYVVVGPIIRYNDI